MSSVRLGSRGLVCALSPAARQARFGRGVSRSVVLLLCGFVLAGCDKACGHASPFTPYKIGDAAPAPALDASGAQVASARPAGSVMQASATLGDVRIPAPAGTVFLRSLVADLDGDGVLDLLAVTATEDGARALALVHAHGAAPGAGVPTLQTVASYNLSQTGCAARAQLQGAAEPGVAERRILADVWLQCGAEGARSLGRTQWVEFGAAAPHVLLDLPTRFFSANRPDLRPLEPDLDGDGNPDFVLEMSRRGQTVRVGWYAKASGLSSAAGPLQSSLDAIAVALRTRAQEATEAKSVAEESALVRAWLFEFCSGALTPLGTASGTCAAALATLDEAQALALVRLGDLPAAFAVHERALVETSLVAGAAAYPRAKMEGILRSATTRKVVADANPFPTESTVERREVARGLLTFESETLLLLREKDRMIRIDLEAATQKPAESPVYPIELGLGKRGAWVDVFASCDGQALKAQVVDEASGDTVDIPLPVAGPLTACSRAGRALPARADHGVVPLEVSPTEVIAEVYGVVVRVQSEPPRAQLAALALGAAPAMRYGFGASSNGKWVVRPTTLGILVTDAAGGAGAARAVLWEGPKVPKLAELGPCAVSPKATRVACMNGPTVVAFR